MTPDADDLPAECRDLLEWYAGDYAVADRASAMDEFVRLMRESRAFEGVDADAYVEQSREGWDEDLPAKPTQRLGKSRRSPLGSSR